MANTLLTPEQLGIDTKSFLVDSFKTVGLELTEEQQQAAVELGRSVGRLLGLPPSSEEMRHVSVKD
jgi:hypothetical protein